MTIARKLVWAAGTPLRWILIALIRLYRVTLSGLLGGQCRFYPSCSSYAESAIRSRGAIVGFPLAAWRVLRCNPFGKGGIDRAPAPRAQQYGVQVREYEHVIHSNGEVSG